MRYLLLISLLLFAMTMSAQDVYYKYDNAGNRTSRVLTLYRSASESAAAPTAIDDNINNQKVKIYPNPTKGQFAVEVVNCPENLQGEFYLYDMSGKTISHQKAVPGKIYFDLGNHSPGVYILKIVMNGESANWKIIRE